MPGFYERGSFQTKWTATALLFAGAVMGALVSGLRPLIALSGLMIVAAGLALTRDWAGLTSGLRGGYARFGMPVPAAMLRFMGRVLIFIGAVWTIAPLLNYL